KLAKRMLAKQKSHFAVFQFLNTMEGASAEELDEFLVRYNMNGIELNEEGFKKLSEEISLDTIETKLEMPWGKQNVTLFYGEVPQGESVELLVLRKAFARQLLPDGKVGRATEHCYTKFALARYFTSLLLLSFAPATLPRSSRSAFESLRGPALSARRHLLYTARGGAKGPVVLMVFKTIARVLRGFGGGFDSHTLPPYLSDMTVVTKKRGGKRRH